MSNKTFLPKEDQSLPDNYSVSIFYISGKHEVIELASHNLNKECGLLELWTKDDICSWVVMANIQRIEFDKNFSKMVAIKQKMDKKVENG